jgi:hypothetical protein
MSPQVGQPVQVHVPDTPPKPDRLSAAQIKEVNTDGTVDLTDGKTNVAYVEVGGTAPVGVNFAQEIALA